MTLPARSNPASTYGPDNKLLSTREVAARLGMSLFGVNARVKDGSLPHVLFGNRVKILERDAEKFVNEIATQKEMEKK